MGLAVGETLGAKIFRKGRWLAEFILIVVGVLAALAVDDWREDRADRAVELYLVQGIRADLDRDSLDLGTAIVMALARAAGADELLRLAGDPEAGIVHRPPTAEASVTGVPGPAPSEQGFAAILEDARQQYPVGEITPQQALYLIGALQRFDLADGTYRQASASGRLDVIEDTRLRVAIGDYYFNAIRFGSTVDERVDRDGEQLRIVLAEVGLSPFGGVSDSYVTEALRDNADLVAELKNTMGFALRQIENHRRVQVLRGTLAADLDRWVLAQR